MDHQIIQDWTRALDGDDTLAPFEYRVVRVDDQCQQQVRDETGTVIGSILLPDGVRMDRQSFDVMLRFALTQIAA
ncbi:MAG: hypothetical protein AAFX44_01025 [Pseudomonadota bacterium]